MFFILTAEYLCEIYSKFRICVLFKYIIYNLLFFIFYYSYTYNTFITVNMCKYLYFILIETVKHKTVYSCFMFSFIVNYKTLCRLYSHLHFVTNTMSTLLSCCWITVYYDIMSYTIITSSYFTVLFILSVTFFVLFRVGHYCHAMALSRHVLTLMFHPQVFRETLKQWLRSFSLKHSLYIFSFFFWWSEKKGKIKIITY